MEDTPRMYTSHDADGRLGDVNWILQPSIIEMLKGRGESYVEGWHPSADFYVTDGGVQPRPDNPASLVGSALHGLPAPCRVGIDGQWQDCATSTFDLSVAGQGKHRVIVQAFPLKDAVFDVDL